MKDLIAHFHYATTEHFRLGWELAVRELSEFPVWARFLQLQENAGRGPRGSNESWVATYEDNNGIECWHGELKKKGTIFGELRGASLPASLCRTCLRDVQRNREAIEHKHHGFRDAHVL